MCGLGWSKTSEAIPKFMNISQVAELGFHTLQDYKGVEALSGAVRPLCLATFTTGFGAEVAFH